MLITRMRCREASINDQTSLETSHRFLYPTSYQFNNCLILVQLLFWEAFSVVRLPFSAIRKKSQSVLPLTWWEIDWFRSSLFRMRMIHTIRNQYETNQSPPRVIVSFNSRILQANRGACVCTASFPGRECIKMWHLRVRKGINRNRSSSVTPDD